MRKRIAILALKLAKLLYMCDGINSEAQDHVIRTLRDANFNDSENGQI